MKQPYVSLLALVAVVLMAVALVLESRSDTRARIAEAEQLMIAQGNAIAGMVAETNLHGLEAYNSWEKEAKGRLIDNAKWLGWADTSHHFSRSDLNKFAGDLNLWRILFYDRNGNLQKSSAPSAAADSLPILISPDFIHALAEGRLSQGVLGYLRARVDGLPRLVGGATRPGGGAVIVCANAGDMRKTRVEISPGHLLKAFGEIEGLRYVVMQDHTGILASSTSRIGFQLPVEDPALAPLREGAEFVTREFVAESGPVLEVARIVALPAPADASKSALLRVGLDAGLLQEMRTATRHRSTLRVMIFAGSLVLITVLLLAWQRQAVLHREVRKITRELRLREEEARRRGKLVAMGNLAAGVAHEIRNPLNTIHMLAQSLGRSRDLPETVTDKAGHIRDESARIESIVQQFLDFARPRDPVLESLNLGALIRETVAVHQAALHGDRLRIEVDAPDCRTRLDRHFVVEIVENLVRNAREALQDRGTIAVSLDCGHRWAELVVEDDGPGIPPDEREKIFDLYFTTKSSGSGLGLSLVSRMVTAMGGQFNLEPEGGRLGGARFLVRFPRQRSET